MKKFERIDYLDSVRGIAAMMVVIYHYIGWHWGKEKAYHLASMIFNGSDAVSFFFVLSGFVLSFKYLHSNHGIDLGYYTYKRILRLYPAFIVTVLINFVYWNRDMVLDGDIIGIIIQFFKNPNRLWQELFMVRGQHIYYIPGWTLGVEMALSMMMPIFIYCARKSIYIIRWFVPMSIFMGAYISDFTFHFLLGILLAYYYYEIQKADWKIKKWYSFRWLIPIIVFVIFSLRHINKIMPFGELYDDIFNKTLMFKFFHFSAVASVIILIWVIRNKNVQQFLNKKPLLFLGKISYSIYLCHWLIVVYIMEHWEKLNDGFPDFYTGFFCILVIYIVATILLSWLMYRFVEKPFIEIAKKYPRWKTGEIL